VDASFSNAFLIKTVGFAFPVGIGFVELRSLLPGSLKLMLEIRIIAATAIPSAIIKSLCDSLFIF
jgi:hypothetical protein